MITGSIECDVCKARVTLLLSVDGKPQSLERAIADAGFQLPEHAVSNGNGNHYFRTFHVCIGCLRKIHADQAAVESKALGIAR